MRSSMLRAWAFYPALRQKKKCLAKKPIQTTLDALRIRLVAVQVTDPNKQSNLSHWLMVGRCTRTREACIFGTLKVV